MFRITLCCLLAAFSAQAQVYTNPKYKIVFNTPSGYKVTEQKVDIPKPEKGAFIPPGVPLAFDTLRISIKPSQKLGESVSIISAPSYMFEMARFMLKARTDLNFKTVTTQVGSWSTQKWPYYPSPYGFTAFVFTLTPPEHNEIGIFGPKKLEEIAQKIIKTLTFVD